MRTYARLIILCAALCVALSACAPLVEDEDAQACDVCATFYPLYALCAPLVEGIEDSLRLTCLTDPQDGCLRDYALSERDVYMLLQADLVVAGGRGLESFASTLQSLGDQGPAVVFTLLNIELYNQDDESEVTEESGHLVGANPHLYMSAQGAKFIVESAAMSMAMLFPACAEQLAQNMDATDARLDELYEQMRRIAACANASARFCSTRRWCTPPRISASRSPVSGIARAANRSMETKSTVFGGAFGDGRARGADRKAGARGAD